MAISEQIIQVLDALCARFGLVIDWTAENVIPYISTLCEKLITWEIWSSVAWMAIMLTLSLISIIFTIIFRRGIKDLFECADLPAPLLAIFWTCLYVGTIIVIGVEIFDIIKCVTFPEMFVFEYVQELISNTR